MDSDQALGPTGVDGGSPLGGVGLYELAVPVVAGLFALVVASGFYAAVVRPTDGVVHAEGVAATLLVPVAVAVRAKRAA